MRTTALMLSLLAACGWAQAANRGETQCNSPSTINTVKEIVREQMLPRGYAAKIPDSVFMAATSIGTVQPTRYDTELQVADCSGLFRVDASAGIDLETARIIEYAYARQPDLVLTLSILLSTPPNGRVYDFQIAYASQIKGGQNQVSVVRVNEFKSYVMGGLLVAKAEAATVTKSTVTEPAPAAPAATEADDEDTPADVADRIYAEADKALNAAYKAAVGRIAPEAKVRLRDEQRKWIARRDKACAADPAAGIGRNSKGELDAMYCMTKFARDRTSALLKISAPGAK